MKLLQNLERFKKNIVRNIQNRKWPPWVRLYGRSLLRLINEKYFHKASALSFVTLLNIVPLLIVLVSLTTHLPIFSRIMDMTRNYVFTHFVPNSSEAIANYLDTFSHKASGLPTLSLLFLVYTVFALAKTIQDALSNIWKKERAAKTIWVKAFQWLMLTLTPLFISASVTVMSFCASMEWFETTTFIVLKVLFVSVFPVFLNTCVFILFYSAISSYHVEWFDRFVGALTAAIFFEIGQLGFSFYISRADDYHVIYGALAAIPIFFIWLYMSWLIIIFGALVIDERHSVLMELRKHS